MTRFEEMLKRNGYTGDTVYYSVNIEKVVDVNVTDCSNDLYSIDMRFSYLHDGRMTFTVENIKSEFTTTFYFTGEYDDFIEECETTIKEIKNCDSFIELVTLLY